MDNYSKATAIAPDPIVCATYCMPIPPDTAGVGRSLLRDDVYRRLRDAIVDGTFMPGEQLKDGQLADWLGVSRTPIREALLRLGDSGLVVALPGRSTTVTAIDPRAVRDARDVIAAMHSLAVREVAGGLSDDDLKRMREANRRFTKAVKAGDVGAALDADDELHEIPVAALGNDAVASVIDHFGPLVRRAERLRFSRDGHKAGEIHERLIELLATGDAERAATVAFDIWHSLPAEESPASQ
jgi:DNA-binding GntR family transcriptional regulator